MDSAQDSIGVVVLEPNKQLLDKLCACAQRVWGKYEVLPRQTGKELALAAQNLTAGLVIVRASFQRSSTLIQSTLLDMYAAGAQILIVQDTPFRVSESSWVTVAGIHFLPDRANDEQLHDLLTMTLVRHCMPQLNKLI
ncbi:MAG: hypothetical protein KJ798_09205 [Gammaproteobacteria bacterium]|nr:hypothetical protein [Gammaproteobacteria bacterium]MBU0850540.1 hypothetical protein [Gammaproteobacteria bacterium]MBU1268334.1 hypothetical protein [Gammaproteobacteria bacterium]MBU1530178.1 hypothetical protein [Gammaproteobacteria bacterium]MBU1780552.1 hypothetical protein [Gammaproteobacteria bacterium]